MKIETLVCKYPTNIDRTVERWLEDHKGITTDIKGGTTRLDVKIYNISLLPYAKQIYISILWDWVEIITPSPVSTNLKERTTHWLSELWTWG